MFSNMNKGCNVSYPAFSGSAGVALKCTVNNFQGHGILREEKKKVTQSPEVQLLDGPAQ